MIGALALATVLGGSLAMVAIDDALDDTTGDDTLDGDQTDERFFGGEGDDLIHGGAGNDHIYGQTGSDTVSGGEGQDTIAMGEGNDFYGFDGTDATNEAGDDLVRGGQGNDWLQDADGSDTLYGGLGDDILIGAGEETDADADLLGGGYGDDVIIGDNGDTINGGAGDDTFGVLFTFGNGADPVTLSDYDPANEALTIAVSDDLELDSLEWLVNFDPHTGTATVDIWGVRLTEAGPVNVTAETAVVLQNMTAESAAAVSLTLSDSMDDITAPDDSPQQLSTGDDSFDGTAANEVVQGNGGADTLNGAAGDDTLMGGDGNDSINGGADDDRLVGNSGNDSFSGGEGDDTLVMGEGHDTYGFDGTNATSEAGDDIARGGTGNDWLQDAEGENTLYGGLGDDTVIGASETGNDTTADLLGGGYGDDLIVGDNGDIMNGGEGEDAFGVGFTFGAGYAPVTITDLDAENEAITIALTDDMTLGSMDWSVDHDPETGVATIDIWGAQDIGSGPVLLPVETAIVLQNVTAADVANLSIAFNY